MIRIWESQGSYQEAKVLHEFSGSIGHIYSFAADEHHAVGETADGKLRVWDLSGQNPVGKVLGGYSGWVLRVCPKSLGGIAEFSKHEADGSELEEGKGVAV